MFTPLEIERREQAFLKVITYAEFGKNVPDSPYNVRLGGPDDLILFRGVSGRCRSAFGNPRRPDVGWKSIQHPNRVPRA